jgi:hypothetical protein
VSKEHHRIVSANVIRRGDLLNGSREEILATSSPAVPLDFAIGARFRVDDRYRAAELMMPLRGGRGANFKGVCGRLR